MKRRDFVRNLTIAGAAAGTLHGLTNCQSNNSQTDPQEEEILQALSNAKAILNIENDFLKVTVYDDASAKISDKKHQKSWDMGTVAIQDNGPIDQNLVWFRAERTLMEQYPGRFIGEREGEHIRYKLINRRGRVVGNFLCQYQLEKDFLALRILELSESLPSLIFPPPITSEKVVVPHHAGRLIHKPQADIWTRQFLPFFTHLNMRWIGGLKDDAAWIGIFDDLVVDAGGFLANNSLTAGWLKSLGQWGKNYAIRYKFIKGGYVELAKTYRNYLIEKGQFKSLKEKMAGNPRLKNLLGGRTLTYFQAWPPLNKDDADNYLFTPEQRANRLMDKLKVDFTHQDVGKSLLYARQKGFKKGLVMLRGWIKGGYDASHPDIWPPESALGSIDDFKQLMTNEDQTVMGLHDNYQDIYADTQSFPKGINRRQNGDYMAGGLWAPGQAYILNSKNSIEYAKRNWQQMKTLNPAAMFIDTATASKLEESYETNNTQTRLQDYQRKMALLQHFKDEGTLVGSEEGSETGTTICDWFESRHARHAGETIPLWSLVFHDSVFMSRYTTFEPGRSYPGYLEDMLWGYHLHFFMRPQFGNIRPDADTETVGFGATEMTEELFNQSFHVDQWHEQIGDKEMLSHRFLSDDSQVEETVFETGLKIVVNFSSEKRQVENMTIPAQSYKIIG